MPTAQYWYGASGVVTNDQIQGGGYDGVGNQTAVSPFVLTYDGESRMTKAIAG